MTAITISCCKVSCVYFMRYGIAVHVLWVRYDIALLGLCSQVLWVRLLVYVQRQPSIHMPPVLFTDCYPHCQYRPKRTTENSTYKHRPRTYGYRYILGRISLFSRGIHSDKVIQALDCNGHWNCALTVQAHWTEKSTYKHRPRAATGYISRSIFSDKVVQDLYAADIVYTCPCCYWHC